jgi:N-sulfoglucosamine sulfohydrolase
MERRTLLKGIAAAPALLRSQQQRPNILLVVSDDHSVPYLGAYGSQWLKTPNFDRFAAEGVRFNKMFVAAPHCVPSRAAIMTGRSPVAIRMGRFHTPMPADVVTLPELLREQGYRTGVCGRYFHLDGVLKPAEITQTVYRQNNLRTWTRRVDFLDVSNQTHAVRKFEEFLDGTPSDKPWFFWINYNDPHHPWDKTASKLDPAVVPMPRHLPDLPELRDDLARHCAEIQRMDGLFGEALEVLRGRGFDSNTLIVFVGDNGMAFPNGKGTLYDPGINVPLLVRWKDRIKPAVADHLVSGEDLAPTLLEAAGAPVPRSMSGKSFFGLLTQGSYEPRKYIFSARLHHGLPMSLERKSAQFDLGRCVRSERWKLIYTCTPHMEYAPIDSWNDPGWLAMVSANRAGTLQPEFVRRYFTTPRPVYALYDLQKDPSETDNLYGRPETAAVEKELIAALTEKMILDFDFLPPPIRE